MSLFKLSVKLEVVAESHGDALVALEKALAESDTGRRRIVVDAIDDVSRKVQTFGRRN